MPRIAKCDVDVLSVFALFGSSFIFLARTRHPRSRAKCARALAFGISAIGREADALAYDQKRKRRNALTLSIQTP